MKIEIISAGTRIGRKSHNVTMYLKKLLDAGNYASDIIDLQALELGSFEEVLRRHTNPSENIKMVSERLMKADAQIWISPEYNGSYTAALKNMVDQLGKEEFTRKAIGIVSVSGGALAGMRCALAMQHLALALFSYPSPYMLTVPEVNKRVDDNGNLLDDAFETKCQNFLKEFCWLAEALSAKSV